MWGYLRWLSCWFVLLPALGITVVMWVGWREILRWGGWGAIFAVVSSIFLVGIALIIAQIQVYERQWCKVPMVLLILSYVAFLSWFFGCW